MKSKILLDKDVVDNNYPKCDMKGCNKPGLFKAPKNKHLKEYFNFCKNHVSEYNKNWNFYDGMSVEEIEIEHTKDIYKRNPTWNFGIKYFNKDNSIGFDNLQNLFSDMFKYHKQTKIVDKKLNDALKIMNLPHSFTVEDLKSQYKKLVKKYHPDLSKNEQDKKIKEEKFKQINNAYQKIDRFLKNNK